MKKAAINIMIFFCAICTLCTFVSCTNNNNIEEKQQEIEGIKLTEGSVLSNDNGEYNNFYLKDNRYTKVDSTDEVWAYNLKTGNYFGKEQDKFFTFCNGHKTYLDDVKNSDENFSISPDGKYLLFFRNDNGYSVIILSMEDGKQKEFKSDVLISGKLIDWVQENTLVYYGVNPDKNQNGIFTFDLEKSEEKLEYKFDVGEALYLKGMENGAVFLHEQIDEGKFLKKIDLNTGKVEVLSGNVIMVYDLVTNNEEVYILAKIKNNNPSLYKIVNNATTRLVYDFPSEISITKGLKLDENGNVLFIGTKKGASKEDIFKCTSRGDLSIIENQSSEYVFVN